MQKINPAYGDDWRSVFDLKRALAKRTGTGMPGPGLAPSPAPSPGRAAWDDAAALSALGGEADADPPLVVDRRLRPAARRQGQGRDERGENDPARVRVVTSGHGPWDVPGDEARLVRVK